MPRKLISSGSYLEPEIGFSRAVRVGQFIAVAGTAPIAAAGGVPRLRVMSTGKRSAALKSLGKLSQRPGEQ